MGEKGGGDRAEEKGRGEEGKRRPEERFEILPHLFSHHLRGMGSTDLFLFPHQTRIRNTVTKSPKAERLHVF